MSVCVELVAVQERLLDCSLLTLELEVEVEDEGTQLSHNYILLM